MRRVGEVTTAALSLAVALGLLAAPLRAGVEQPGRVFRIGILGNVPAKPTLGVRASGAFIQGLRELGYVEGRNVTLEHPIFRGKV